MADWRIMYNDFPCYEINVLGIVRNVKTKKIMRERNIKGYPNVLLRNKWNCGRWVWIGILLEEYFTEDELCNYDYDELHF